MSDVKRVLLAVGLAAIGWGLLCLVTVTATYAVMGH